LTWWLPSFAYLRCSFFYTIDQRLQITGGTMCLDSGDNIDPVYGTSLDFSTCTAGNANQIFTIENVQVVVTNTTFPDPNTICHQGEQEILKPTATANLTQLVRTVARLLLLLSTKRLRSIRAGRFPSSTAQRKSMRRRARTSPYALRVFLSHAYADRGPPQVYLAPASSTNPTKDGVVVGQKSSPGASEYDLTLTLPTGMKPAANSQLVALEHFSGFSNNGNTATSSEKVKF
jgi:hypothetical protein